MLRWWDRLSNSSPNLKLVILAILSLWLVVLLLITVAMALFMERSGRAQIPETGMGAPIIWLEPDSGPLDSLVTVYGQGWPPERTVLIELNTVNETILSGFGIANTAIDPDGRFEVSFVIPPDSRWEGQDQLKIIAHEFEGETIVPAFFNIVELPAVPTAVITGDTVVLPTATSTQVIPSATPKPAEPGDPLATATADVNIRSGPGTTYAILGLLQTGQNAFVSGVSPDGQWWQIETAITPAERGWVSARYVTTQNTANVTVAQPPTLPPQPATPTPVVIRDWRGEYFNNADLSGDPALVRNDQAVSFDWGVGSPAAGLNADSFSARWSRNLEFPAGTYRFYLRADDGVRFWLDDKLVIDRWQDSAPTTYSVVASLSGGTHRFRVEYYERSGTALVQLTWQLEETYPDWKGEYFDNPGLSGAPALVRNDLEVSFGWGPNSPGPGVPADKFSARWSRDLHFSAGTYRFTVLVDDGARLWVDDRLLIDRWRAGAPTRYSAEITLTGGIHRLRLEYFEDRYDAQVRLDWERLSDNYPDWKAEYFDNRRLAGDPVLVRNETKIDHNWGHSSPVSGLPADNFSARWSRKANFQAGTYLFTIKVDDGVRLWVDDKLLLDEWQDGGSRTLTREMAVTEGQRRVKLEYYERGGEARIELAWQKKETPVNQPPQALPGGPYTVDEGGTVTFDGRASRDPDGMIVAYEWDFQYDGRNFVPMASGPTASAGFQDGPARLTVALRVTDDRGATQIGTTQVTVQNVAPTVETGGPYAGQVSNLITFVGTATDRGVIDQTGLAYRWEFGDESQGSGPVVSHAYDRAGTYTVRLTVTDKDGASGSDTAAVQVSAVQPPPQAPQADISGPTSGLVGEPLTFSGDGSSDSDGSIVSYIWDFGDGVAANGANVSHPYGAAGFYTVRLTVIDDTGLSAAATLTVQITEPTPTNQPPTAGITGPVYGLVGEALTFDGTGSSDGDGTLVDYRWDFGDGTTASGPTVSYGFSTAGNYVVSLTVTDDGGLTDSETQVVEIAEVGGANP